MASPFVYENGFGGTVGARLATRRPVYTSGPAWFIGVGGVDAAAPAGRDRSKPLATLSQAHTNASAGDVIVLMEGVSLTLSVLQTISKARLHIYGEGEAFGPTVPRIIGGTGSVDIDLTGAGIWLENLYFSFGAANGVRVRVSAAACQVVSCYFESGNSEADPAMRFVTGAGQNRVVNTIFKSVASGNTVQPFTALEIANAMSDLELDTVVFDGGVSGWSDYALKATAAVTGLVGMNVSFLNHSRLFTATGSSYKFHGDPESGSTPFEFTA